MGKEERTGIGGLVKEPLGTDGETGTDSGARDGSAEAIVGKLIRTPIGTKTDLVTIGVTIDGLNINDLSVD